MSYTPYSRYIYWTDWGGKPKIERVGMDGTKRETLVSKNMTFPNGLTIDHATRRIYWTDPGTLTIEYLNLVSMRRKVSICLQHLLSMVLSGSTHDKARGPFWAWLSTSPNRTSRDKTNGFSSLSTDGVAKVQPSTRPGIEPGTFWLVVRDLTNCANLAHMR